ncbi:hypothetical protein BGZ54_003046, partial [Gamsiella multidivaricata]
MYPPPATQPGSAPGAAYGPSIPPATGMYPPPPGSPAGNPYGVPTQVPTPHPTGFPASMPQPSPAFPYGQPPPQQYPPAPYQQPTSPTVGQQRQYPGQGHVPHQQQPSQAFAVKCGPMIRYQSLDLHNGHWIGSVLVVSKPEAYGQPAPVLTWSDGRAGPQMVAAQPIDTFNQSVFWRFALVIPQDMQATKKITYSINGGPSYWFFVAGRAESFRWMFYSCNGFSSATDS